MIRQKLAVALLAASTCFVVAPVFAHHAFEAEFDIKQPLKLTGTLQRVEWVNPHAYFYLDVSDAAGKVEHWQLENLPPLGLRRGGLMRDMVPLGATISIEGYRAKDGSKDLGWVNTIHLSDGRTILLIKKAEDANQ
jgi:hypothetical protein